MSKETSRAEDRQILRDRQRMKSRVLEILDDLRKRIRDPEIRANHWSLIDLTSGVVIDVFLTQKEKLGFKILEKSSYG